MKSLEKAIGQEISKEVISLLRETFPDKIPTKRNIELTEVTRLQGQQEVIHWLSEIKELQDTPEGAQPSVTVKVNP